MIADNQVVGVEILRVKDARACARRSGVGRGRVLVLDS